MTTVSHRPRTEPLGLNYSRDYAHGGLKIFSCSSPTTSRRSFNGAGFLETVADDLNKKVEERIGDLFDKPEQLKFKIDLQEGILGEP